MQRAWVKTTEAPVHTITLGIAIAWHINDVRPEDGAYPSMAELCEWTHKDARNVRRDLKLIPELVVDVGKGGRTNRYWMDIDLEAIEAGLAAEKKARRTSPKAKQADVSEQETPGPHVRLGGSTRPPKGVHAPPVTEVNGSELHLAPSAAGGTPPAPAAALSAAVGEGETTKQSEHLSLPFTLAEIAGKKLEEMTEAERGKLNKAAKQLSEIGATPADVRERASRYSQRHPSWTLTEMALVKHWSTLATRFSELDRYQKETFERWFGDDAESKVNRLSSAERDALESEIIDIEDYVADLERERRAAFDLLDGRAQRDLIDLAGPYNSPTAAATHLAENPGIVENLHSYWPEWDAIDEWIRAEIEKDPRWQPKRLARFKFMSDDKRAAAVDELWAGVAAAAEPWTSLSADVRQLLSDKWEITADRWLAMDDYTRSSQLASAESLLRTKQLEDNRPTDLFDEDVLL